MFHPVQIKWTVSVQKKSRCVMPFCRQISTFKILMVTGLNKRHDTNVGAPRPPDLVHSSDTFDIS